MRRALFLAFFISLFFSALPGSASLRSQAQSRGFKIGAGVGVELLNISSTTLRALLPREFNSFTPVAPFFPLFAHPRNNNSDISDFDLSVAAAMVIFGRDHDMVLRGHPLVYYHPNVNPDYLQCSFPSPHPAIRSTPVNTASVSCLPANQRLAWMQNHISTIVGYFQTNYPGRIYAWDVVNEVVDLDTTTATYGIRHNDVWGEINPSDREEYIRTAFTTAYQAAGSDPSIKLCYNDFDDEGLNAKSNAVYALMQNLKSEGVPVNCVGFQMHKGFDSEPIWSAPPSVSDMAANFKRFSDLGLEVQITEMEINLNGSDSGGFSSDDLTQQANFYSNVLQACLAVSGCRALTTWTVSDGQSDVPTQFPGYGKGVLFDDSFAPKPAYDAVENAFHAFPTGLSNSGELSAFPSPFNPLVDSPITFQFRVDGDENVSIKVKDQFGRAVWETALSAQAGVNQVRWNGRNARGTVAASGIYYLLLEVNGSLRSKKRFGIVK